MPIQSAPQSLEKALILPTPLPRHLCSPRHPRFRQQEICIAENTDYASPLSTRTQEVY